MSLIVPSTFDIALIASSYAPSSKLVEVGEVEPEVVGQRDPAQLDAAFGGEHVPRHDVGVVLHVREHDASPSLQIGAAQVYATRLIASVALRTNTTSSDCGALTNFATLRRAASNAAVDSSAIVYTPRWMFA